MEARFFFLDFYFLSFLPPPFFFFVQSSLAAYFPYFGTGPPVIAQMPDWPVRPWLPYIQFYGL